MVKRTDLVLRVVALAAAWALGWSGTALAQGSRAGAPLPADPWPREIIVNDGIILVYQPQVDSWRGNLLDFRAAVAVRAIGGTQEVFGTMWATAHTRVDRVSRIVALDDFTVTKSSFPTRPDGGASYMAALRTEFGPGQRTIALDRLEASLAASGAVKPAGTPVNNDPPRILISETPAILVPIDGAPVVRPVPGAKLERVINTWALIIREQGTSAWYLHVYDGWLTSGAVAGPWHQAMEVPPALGPVTRQFARSGQVDLLDGGNTRPQPALASGVPAVYVSETPRSSSCSGGRRATRASPGPPSTGCRTPTPTCSTTRTAAATTSSSPGAGTARRC